VPDSTGDSSHDSTDSRASDIDRMRRLIKQYDSLEDPDLKAEFLAAHGLTYPVIKRYRRIVALADRRSSPHVSTVAIHVRPSRRGRTRRRRTAPPNRSYEKTRPDASLQVSRSDTRIVIVLTIDIR
jgi:hypothetical protein